MQCPKCARESLERRLGPKGVIVDMCPTCGGVWLDQGEIYAYARSPRRVYEMLKKAYTKTSGSPRKCPRCIRPLSEVRIPAASLVIEACPGCGGNWFDKGEVAQLGRALEAQIAPAAEAQTTAQATAPAHTTAEEERIGRPIGTAIAAGAYSGTGLTAGAGLALRSMAVLASLYGMLAAALLLAVAYLGVEARFAFISAAGILILHYLLGPFLTDLTLRWMHGVRWVQPDELPDHLRDFISGACEKHGFPFPAVGIIPDGNPNAMTYGHFPSDSRLVLTRGVMELLDEKELQAVVGHEIGHMVHWDMAVMTMAALVPMALYYIYRFAVRMSRSRAKKNPFPLVAAAAFALYFVTEYVVLWLSRIREFYADRFSGELTREPNRLALALVKIAYGLAGRQAPRQEEEREASLARTGAARALGIFDPIAARALVAGSLGGASGISTENLLGAMQWDLWNPWAAYYELGSTHPLTAKRLQRLGEQAAGYGQRPLARFDLAKPESYLDEFLADLSFLVLPVAAAAAAGVLAAVAPAVLPLKPLWWNAAAAFSLGCLARTRFSYRLGFYPEMSVSSLLKRVKVSKVRGIPVRLQGTVIGRGVPGFILSEDLVLQDKTGFIFLDYDQPLAILNIFFAITRAAGLVGKEVVVEGWYRRAPVPYVEVRSIRQPGAGGSVCRVVEAKYILCALALGAAVYFGLIVRIAG